MTHREFEIIDVVLTMLEEIEPWGPEITEAHGILSELYYRSPKEISHASA